LGDKTRARETLRPLAPPRDALLKAVSGSTAYARKVAGVVLKGNRAALASFVPARARAARGGKAKSTAASASPTGAATKKKAPRTKAARGKLRARRAQVKARAKTLAIGPTVAVKAAKATKKSGAKGAKKSAAKAKARK
jgi:hypothetical protein